MKERVEWIDVAKGIGMLAIIAGHFGCPEINRLVFPWHVPVFFVLAGFFISTKGCFVEFIFKKCWALLMPYLITSLVVVAGLSVCAWATGGKVVNVLQEELIAVAYGAGSPVTFFSCEVSAIGNIWFLEALLLALVIARWLCSHRVIVGFIIGVCIATASWVTARYVWLPFNVQSGGAGALLVYTGYVAYNRTNVFKSFNWWWFVAGCGAYILDSRNA